jgi:hypothetical protein
VRQGNIADVVNLQRHANYAYDDEARYTKAREGSQPGVARAAVLYDRRGVIHDLTTTEATDVGRLLGDRKIQQAITSRATRLPANPQRDPTWRSGSGTTVRTRANWVKNGTTIAGLGWNVWTALQQPLGVQRNAHRAVGARGLGRMFRDAASLESSAWWVHAQSEMMRLRHSTMQREIADLRSTLKRSGSWFDNALRTATGNRLEQEDLTESFLFLIQTQQLAIC